MEGSEAGPGLSPRISPFNEPALGEWPRPGLSLMVPVPVSSSALFQKIFFLHLDCVITQLGVRRIGARIRIKFCQSLHFQDFIHRRGTH